MSEIHTFSIAARCDRTGELGVAVSSAVPAVGAMCPYLKAGVGAVSTQSWVNPYLAIEAIARMSAGADAEAALNGALAGDSRADLRQIIVIGRLGPGAAWTGAGCTPWHGQFIGPDYAIAGNMLTGAPTLAAMRDAWTGSASLDLDERLMRALEAAQAAGGDRRGKQSAALKIVGTEAYAKVDLRVDEHAEPVAELRRVLTVARVQLFPFVSGMPRADRTAATLPEETTAMLLLTPADRPRR